MMYVSESQIRLSLQSLQSLHPFFGMAFLAFKATRLPVDETATINFSALANEFLNTHYRPITDFDGFYQPMKTGRSKDRWLASRYGSTSLQRITKDSFGDALIHPSGSSEWGWQKTYIDSLKERIPPGGIPAFHLAVWLFRDAELPQDISPEEFVEEFMRRFYITSEERQHLFDESISHLASPWLSPSRLSQWEILATIGAPEDYIPKEGVTLRRLGLSNTGPAKQMTYEPSERLNIITGDNGLGKTFILECVWWALTGHWADMPILPNDKKIATISYQLAVGNYTLPETEVHYNRRRLRWDSPDLELPAGVVLFSRFDGAFAVFDPAKISPGGFGKDRPIPLALNRSQVWNGLEEPGLGSNTRRVCNGLIADWVLWSRGGPAFEPHRRLLAECLQTLSPDEDLPLKVGEPVRLPGDTREMPTLDVGYGTVPVIHASAGVQRIVTLAYLLVWTWSEHQVNSESIGQAPQDRVVLIIDEIESHLHPKWQRTIVPGLMSVVRRLWQNAAAQIHIATHSPLVLASAESVFDEEVDDLHLLELKNKEVQIREQRFIKRGTADAWLMSDTFGLYLARSAESESAIKHAMALQQQEDPDPAEVRSAHAALSKSLAEDDNFWPRWRYFAEQHGVRE